MAIYVTYQYKKLQFMGYLMAELLKMFLCVSLHLLESILLAYFLSWHMDYCGLESATWLHTWTLFWHSYPIALRLLLQWWCLNGLHSFFPVNSWIRFFGPRLPSLLWKLERKKLCCCFCQCYWYQNISDTYCVIVYAVDGTGMVGRIMFAWIQG